jgi:hypothetical protein
MDNFPECEAKRKLMAIKARLTRMHQAATAARQV